ncbi:hypothetical protein Naga_101502g1 [Nannochloropsis gaditana]|uniref:Uncharacterized protein n=1 Tax=Nannochloropsis gaditana TaxID=72520 RepID=W7SZ65_9STRA|nr:hypothetical protein Naga_101502g1 [Nannochloropsis gaditana]
MSVPRAIRADAWQGNSVSNKGQYVLRRGLKCRCRGGQRGECPHVLLHRRHRHRGSGQDYARPQRDG